MFRKAKGISLLMKKYNVTEIFESIQGEGYWAGTPVTFIRLANCNLNCWFCDTDFSCKYVIGKEEILSKIKTLHVVITGGEPLLQIKENDPLLLELKKKGKYVHLETNGTFPVPFGLFSWVTVSPKARLPLKAISGDELKVVYTGQDISVYENLNFKWFYLQPCWVDSKDNAHEVIRKIKESKKWRLSLQIHKYIGIA